jgi:hypothetical protein
LVQEGLLTFDPADGYSGNTSFTYSATDNTGNTDATPANYLMRMNTPPVANNITITAMISGGPNTAIPALAATDDGSIQSYTILSLPPSTEGTLYLNGVALTSLTQVATLTPAQVTQLSFTPAATFSGTTFTYTATDNLGITDVTPATYTIPLSIIVSGAVYNDVNGMSDNTINGATTNLSNALYISLVNAGGTVIATTAVAANGAYSFAGVASGNYTVVLHQTVGGSNVASLPTGWVNTGEDCCDNTGNDGTANGILPISVSTGNLLIAVFGIEQPPTILDQTYTVAQPAVNGFLTLNGTGAINSPGALAGTDAEDGALGTGAIFNIIVNAAGLNGNKVFYNGVEITGAVSIPNYNPALLQVQYTGIGSSSVSFTYQTFDAAGVGSNYSAYTINWLIPLPIKLESFTAAPQGNSVILNWVVSEETNTATYEIEFSVNAVSFTSIGNVVASNRRNYSMLHTTPVGGINFYRLKTTDKDGKVSYSEIRKVNFGKGIVLSVYPNPATDVLNITVTGAMVNKPAVIRIITIDGKVLLQKQIKALSQTEAIDVSRLTSGKYIIRIVTNKEVINKTIQVVR